MFGGLAAALVAAALTGGCSGDDDGVPPIDATLDGEVDAPACVLPTTIINCTDNTPCTAMCAEAYCYTFMQVGQLCTQPCTTIEQCPSGWTCNNMGRCRPPG